MPRDSAVAMEEAADEETMINPNQTPIRGIKPPVVMTVKKEKIDCSPVYDLYQGCGDDSSLFLSPYGLYTELDLLRDSFQHSGIQFIIPETTRAICVSRSRERFQPSQKQVAILFGEWPEARSSST